MLSQDPNYKDLYIETFENECMGGYSSGNRQSCTKGMFERIYMGNKGTIEGLCFDELQGAATATSTASATARETACKPVYLELYSAFVPGADIDINEIEIVIAGFPTLGVHVRYPILGRERNRETSIMVQYFEYALTWALVEFGFEGITNIRWLDGSSHTCIFSCDMDKKTLNMIRSYLASVGG